MQTDFAALTIMVVDDSKTIRRTAQLLLQQLGCTVVTATDGFDALAKITQTRFDMLIVDIMMPRLDGYQTCTLLKNHPDYTDIYVVMLSSKDGLFDQAQGQVVGADAYLSKPFGKQDILRVIKDSQTT